jgi:hypothetical protein
MGASPSVDLTEHIHAGTPLVSVREGDRGVLYKLLFELSEAWRMRARHSRVKHISDPVATNLGQRPSF